MQEISQRDIIDAFASRKKGKLNLLYLHFKDKYFHKGLSAEIIAQKISEELGIKITTTHIYDIHRRYTNSGDMNETEQIKEQLSKLEQAIESLQKHPQQIHWTTEQLADMIQSSSTTLEQLQKLYDVLSDSGQKKIVHSQIKRIKEEHSSTSIPKTQTEKSQRNKYQNAEDENKNNPFSDLMKDL